LSEGGGGGVIMLSPNKAKIKIIIIPIIQKKTTNLGVAN